MQNQTIRSILVGVDLAVPEGPDAVLSAAARLAAALDADLHVVHAVESGPLAPPLLPSLAQEMEKARSALDLYLDLHLPEGVATASRHVGLGRAHEVLADRVDAMEIDLVVVGAHREGPMPIVMLGTTVDRLLRTVSVPCWIVRGSAELPIRRLVTATDFSEMSRRALDWTLDLAHRLGTATPGDPPVEVDVLHVAWPAALRDDPDRERSILLPNLDSEIASARHRAGGAQAVTTHPRVLAAVDPSRGILSHAAREKPDLIVLGTHGRGSMARAILGSVASIVAREAEGDVLLVPPTDRS